MINAAIIQNRKLNTIAIAVLKIIGLCGVILTSRTPIPQRPLSIPTTLVLAAGTGLWPSVLSLSVPSKTAAVLTIRHQVHDPHE